MQEPDIYIYIYIFIIWWHTTYSTVGIIITYILDTLQALKIYKLLLCLALA